MRDASLCGSVGRVRAWASVHVGAARSCGGHNASAHAGRRRQANIFLPSFQFSTPAALDFGTPASITHTHLPTTPAIEHIGNGRVNYIIGYVARGHDAVDVSLDHRGKEHDKINASVHFRSDKHQERYLKTQIVACRYVTSLHMVIVTG